MLIVVAAAIFAKSLAVVRLPNALPSSKGTQILGKLGQALMKAPIRSSPSGRVYYWLKPYEYVVLRQSDKPATYRVLLQNGRLGYVRADQVTHLPYDITAPNPKSYAG